MSAGGFEQPGARLQRSGSATRDYGYPPGWVRGDPRDRNYQREIVDRLERIELLLERLLSERL
jgi:hypothetical protein